MPWILFVRELQKGMLSARNFWLGRKHTFLQLFHCFIIQIVAFWQFQWNYGSHGRSINKRCFPHNIQYHFRPKYHISPVGCCQQYKAKIIFSSHFTRISTLPSALISLQQTKLFCFSCPNISTIFSLDTREFKTAYTWDKEEYSILSCFYHTVD
jgi:hypothetical protein